MWLAASLLSCNTLILAPADLAALPDRSRADRKGRTAAELEKLLAAAQPAMVPLPSRESGARVQDRTIGGKLTHPA